MNGKPLRHRRLALLALTAACTTAAADPVIVGQPVFDPTAMAPNFKPDKVVGDFLSGSYGLGAFGSGSVFDTGAKFLGLSFDESQPIGGIVPVCEPTGLAGCADFGLKATLNGWGKFRTEYRLSASGGSLDVRVTMRATLDLPYDASAPAPCTTGRIPSERPTVRDPCPRRGHFHVFSEADTL